MTRRAVILGINRDGLSGKVAAGVSGTAAIKFGQIFLGMAAVVLLGRFLGPEGFGVYALALVIVQLVGIPINLGMRNLLIRETARLQQSEGWGELHGLLRRAFQLVVGSSLLFVCVGGGLLLAFRGALGEDAFAAYSVALLLFPLLGLLAGAGAVLVGLRQVIRGQFPDLTLRHVVLIAILLGLYALGFHASLAPWGAMTAAVVAIGTAMIVAMAMLLRQLPGEVRRAAPTYRNRAWLHSLLPFSLIAGIMALQSNIAIVMLGALADHEAVGLYRVATQGAVTVSFTMQAANMVIAPYVARLYGAGETGKLQKLIFVTTLFAFATALPLFLVFVFWGEGVLGVLMGPEFAPAATTLAILCLGQIISVGMGPVGLALNMTGHEKDTVIGSILAVSINAVLNVPMILFFGTEGAAISTAASIAAWNVFLARRAFARTGLRTPVLSVPLAGLRRRIAPRQDRTGT